MFRTDKITFRIGAAIGRAIAPGSTTGSTEAGRLTQTEQPLTNTEVLRAETQPALGKRTRAKIKGNWVAEVRAAKQAM